MSARDVRTLSWRRVHVRGGWAPGNGRRARSRWDAVRAPRPRGGRSTRSGTSPRFVDMWLMKHVRGPVGAIVRACGALARSRHASVVRMAVCGEDG